MNARRSTLKAPARLVFALTSRVSIADLPRLRRFNLEFLFFCPDVYVSLYMTFGGVKQGFVGLFELDVS